jgi:hypothetical protein
MLAGHGIDLFLDRGKDSLEFLDQGKGYVFFVIVSTIVLARLPVKL